MLATVLVCWSATVAGTVVVRSVFAAGCKLAAVGCMSPGCSLLLLKKEHISMCFVSGVLFLEKPQIAERLQFYGEIYSV